MCKVPELRLVTYIITSLISCLSPNAVNTFSFNVHDTCGPNGSFYHTLCGEASGLIGDNPAIVSWVRNKYDPNELTDAANRFATKAQAMGMSSPDGIRAQDIADAWLKRGAAKVSDDGSEAAIEFFHKACAITEDRAAKQHPILDKYPGAAYYELANDPLASATATFLYDQCKSASFDSCYQQELRWSVDTVRPSPLPPAPPTYTHACLFACRPSN